MNCSNYGIETPAQYVLDICKSAISRWDNERLRIEKEYVQWAMNRTGFFSRRAAQTEEEARDELRDEIRNPLNSHLTWDKTNHRISRYKDIYDAALIALLSKGKVFLNERSVDLIANELARQTREKEELKND